jgi:hypothetical protein
MGETAILPSGKITIGHRKDSARISALAKKLQTEFVLILMVRRAIPTASWPAAPVESIAITVESGAFASASTKFTRLLLVSFIDSQRASLQDFSIQLTDGCFHVCLRRQFRKSKASGLSGAGIANYLDAGNGDILAGKKLG